MINFITAVTRNWNSVDVLYLSSKNLYQNQNLVTWKRIVKSTSFESKYSKGYVLPTFEYLVALIFVESTFEINATNIQIQFLFPYGLHHFNKLFRRDVVFFLLSVFLFFKVASQESNPSIFGKVPKKGL